MNITRRNRLNHWHTLHGLGVTLLACMAVLALPSAGLAPLTLLIVLGVLSALAGIPHGALDLPVARRMLTPRLGRTWLIWFVGLYTLVATLVISLWLAAPGESLAAFLLLAAAHFGISDTESMNLSGAQRLLEGTARGATVIVFPCAFQQATTAQLFGILTDPHTGAILAERLAFLLPIVLLLLACAIGWRLVRAFTESRSPHAPMAAELATFGLPLALLHPLAGFILYWIGLHSLRVLGNVTTKRMQETTESATASFVRVWGTGLPATLATFVLAVGAWWFFMQGQAISDALVRITFVGLAALNLPHMLFVGITARYR